MENTGPSVLNAPSIEQSYDPISFQNTQQFEGRLKINSPTSDAIQTEKSMTIIQEEEFEESLQPNGKPLFRNHRVNPIETKKVSLKKQIINTERYVDTTIEEPKYVESSKFDSERQSEEFILKMIDKQIYRSALNDESSNLE